MLLDLTANERPRDADNFSTAALVIARIQARRPVGLDRVHSFIQHDPTSLFALA